MDQKLEQALEQKKESQQQKLVIDFDEAVKEEKAKAIEVNFDGKTYELPQNAPAWLPLFINRYSENGVLNDEHNLQMIERLLGKEFAAKIIDEANNFVSFEVVNSAILEPVMAQWGMNAKDVTEGKNGTTPDS